jgi:hypothetical protein
MMKPFRRRAVCVGMDATDRADLFPHLDRRIAAPNEVSGNQALWPSFDDVVDSGVCFTFVIGQERKQREINDPA